jgi:acyl-CoA synthetase (AMP-forming)/AMP-acid ligase II
VRLRRRAGRAPPTGAALLGFARGRLAGYKVPRRVVLVDALPRLGSGKIDRQALARDAAVLAARVEER